jgi:hypothetical protein
VFDVSFTPDASVEPSEWISAVRERCVQRRPMSRRAIRPEEKARLEAVLPAGYSLMWLEGSRRLEVARLLFANAKIRLTTREAFEVHRSVIEWGVDESEDRIPDRAVGLDPLTLRLMAWAMQDWRRVEFMNRWFAGTVAPRLQLDFLPGIACGAHVLLIAPTEPRTIDEYLAAGGAVQRFWLEATNAGLQHQPEMTPLIFARYVRNGLRFSESEGSIASATELARRCDAVFDAPVMKRGLWLGRLGDGPRATSRSVRLPLAKLLLPAKTGAGGAKAMA